MQLDDLVVYKSANYPSEVIWQIVQKWNHFEKQTVGIQLIDAIDIVAANLAEGFGRNHFNENRHFCYYARGSLFEAKCWLKKAYSRKLINENNYQKISTDLEKLAVKINNYINTIGQQAHELSAEYNINTGIGLSENPDPSETSQAFDNKQ